MNHASRLACALGLVAVVAAGPAFADNTATEFLTKASVATRFEIETSELALKRATSPDVKAFAQRMIDDHTAAAAKLKEAAEMDKVDVSLIATSLDKKHRKKLDDLGREDAEDFDEAYMDLQETAHKKAVSLFKDYADDGDKPALKQFAQQTLPTLEAHHKSADEIESKVD